MTDLPHLNLDHSDSFKFNLLSLLIVSVISMLLTKNHPICFLWYHSRILFVNIFLNWACQWIINMINVRGAYLHMNLISLRRKEECLSLTTRSYSVRACQITSSPLYCNKVFFRSDFLLRAKYTTLCLCV